MAFSSVRTIRGRNLAAKVQAGTTQMNFTKFTIGDGTLTGQNQENMTALINQRYTFPVARLKVQSQNVVVVGMSLNNQAINAGFFWREVGVWAQDPDLGEILFAYGNSGTGAEYIDAGGSTSVLEKAFNFDITVSNTAQVTAVIDESLVYATPQDVADALEEAKDYTDLEVSKIVIPDASITQKGIVQLTNTNTGTSQTLAPTQKALGDHVNSTVRHTTQAEKDNWNDKISTSTASNWQKSKVTEDSGLAIMLADGFNLNNIDKTGFYRSISPTNSPDPSINFYYVEHLKHLSGSNEEYAVQKAYNGYKSSLYQRVKNNGVWSPWTVDFFQSGVDRKNELVAALNAKRIAATNTEDFSALVAKVYNIRAITVSGVPFSNDNIGRGDDNQIYYEKPSSLTTKDFTFQMIGNTDIYPESLSVGTNRIIATLRQSGGGNNDLPNGTITLQSSYTVSGITFSLISRSKGSFVFRISVSASSPYNNVRFAMANYVGVGI